MQAVSAPHNGASLHPPLRVAADMSSRWLNASSDFDTAAHAIVDAHKNDGEARDLPVMNLATWGVLPKDGAFALAPLHKGHGPLAEKLGEVSREANVELNERRERLQRTEARIAGLVHFIAEGDQSDYVRKALVDLETQAKTERDAIAV